MVTTNHDRSFHFSFAHQLIKQQSRLFTFAHSQPTYTTWQPLKSNFLLCFFQPFYEVVVFGECLHQCLVGCVNIFGVARKSYPAKRTFSVAKQRANKLGDKALIVESIRFTSLPGKFPKVIPIVKNYAAPFLQLEHETHMPGHTFQCQSFIIFRIGLSQFNGFVKGETVGNVSVNRIVSRSLIGKNIGNNIICKQFFQGVANIANQSHRDCFSL